ncbi:MULTISPECIES: 5-formyltetrahydrofolate cyclo-ligase [Bartonella]|uniref:5-formyltetrahydrofolate cyclo-ligase n=1 Tax=Bartonella chomelii TaxID=236402 RepID=A0ABR6E2A8_9HYPH|nr:MULTISPECIES: 5-formyltetrahydrofolate cyclo-ligase [Bartonella]MBA9082701.1 5-formyltetrahydrofolate cyclo-ligase [Bartonella chomelii]
MPTTSQRSQSISSERSRLRTLGISQRNALCAHERTAFSHRACSHIAHYLEQMTGDCSHTILAGYWPIHSEIDPRPLFDFVSSRGGHVALPAVIDETTMVFRTFASTTQLELMRFNTFGPSANNAVVAPTVIIVPLCAFDNQCHRLGYGAGYYDRAIEHLQKHGHRVHLWGLSFSCQEVESIPERKHDLVLQKIFTEKGFIER